MFRSLRLTGTKTRVAAAIGAGLLLLCACAKEERATVTATDASLRTRTPVSTQTTPSVSSGTSPPSPVPTSAPSDSEVTGPAGLTNPIVAGQPLTYTLTVTNHGPSDATGVIVTDRLPPGAVFISATSSQGSDCRFESGLTLSDSIICDLGDLRLGEGARINVVMMPVTVTHVVSHTAIVAANEIDIDLSDNTFYREAAVQPVADLAVTAQMPDRVVAREATAYTLTVSNRGPVVATGIVLTDVFPAGVMPIWVQSARPVCGRQGRVVGCNLGDLQVNDAATVTLDLSVGGPETLITGTQLAGVHLDLSAPTCTMTQDATQPYVTCRQARLRPGEDVHLRIGVSMDTWITGSFVHTATVAANESDVQRSNNRTAVKMKVSGATPLTATDIPSTADLVLRVNGPQSVIAGQPFTYTYTITNRGGLDASGVRFQTSPPPGTTLSAYSPRSLLCEQRNDTFTCFLRDPHSDETVAFTLVITGYGETPMSMDLDPLMPGWPSCVVIRERSYLHIVDCNLGVLKRGEVTQIQVGFVADGVQERTMTNKAVVNANETDLNAADNATVLTTTVEVEADLSMQCVVSGPAIVGKTLDYSLTIANAGPSDTSGVVLTDKLPTNTSLLSVVASQGDGCQLDVSADAFVCDLGRLSNGESATVVFAVAVDSSLTPELGETLTHFASVAAEQTDPNPSNNEVTESIPVNAEVDLSITSDFGE